MIWFIVGALLACLQLRRSLIQKPIYNGYPVQGYSFAAVLGAAIYGTILWLIFSLWLEITWP